MRVGRIYDPRLCDNVTDCIGETTGTARLSVMSLKIGIILFVLCAIVGKLSASHESVHILEPGDFVNNDKPGLRIFCHKAKSKYVTNMWKTLTMHLSTKLDNYDIYDGSNPSEVTAKHEENNRSWRFNLWGTKKDKLLKINPFVDTCIGINVYPSTEHLYTISMSETRVDVSKFILMLLGVTLYWTAERLSRNPLFYYLCGITLGVTTSTLILIYLVSKLLPKGKLMYFAVATGWTMSFYLAQALIDNAQLIAINYREYVMWYILATSSISFLICYRFGPVTNARTKKIIQWFLQVTGLLCMHYSSYFWEASSACCAVLVLLYNFPIVILHKGRRYWRTMFPERRKFLTDDQYRKEGIKETNKALKDLQEFCSSPECNPWKTVLRLKDPIRFAKFMEGDSHLSDDETQEHDHEITRLIEQCEYTDEEDYDYDL